MKKYIFTILAAILTVFTVSCEKTSAGKTYVASYFQMLGASAMYLGVGDEFVDPGVVELEGGGKVATDIYDMNDAPVDAVSTDEPGFYTIVYSTTNDQGFYFEKERKVYIYDSTVQESLAGTFLVDPEASFYGDGKTYQQKVDGWQANPTAAYHPYCTSEVEITFNQVVGNIYTCSDLFGGWYTAIQGRGYYYKANGASFTYFDMTGYVTLNADMTITLMSSYVECWGDGLDRISAASYDPETKRLSYNWFYAGGQVAAHVEMVKK